MADREKSARSRHRNHAKGSKALPTPPSNPALGNGKRTKSVNSTFDMSSLSSIDVEEKLFKPQVEEPDRDDGPVVFICGNCKSPVGDSLSWDGSEDEQNQIRLKRVTDKVVVGKESRLHEAGKDSMCLIVDLFCRDCHSVLGMVYSSTPKGLDHKRFAFCFNVADIDSYVLGTASQTQAAEGAQEQPVTLEYRGCIEQEITEMKMLVLSMAQRLEEIEAGLPDGYDGV